MNININAIDEQWEVIKHFLLDPSREVAKRKMVTEHDEATKTIHFEEKFKEIEENRYELFNLHKKIKELTVKDDIPLLNS